ncbi:hypothetical protein [Isoptericola rhizosphaerae]|uniref:hypothetical protein n=1 Tax=Isoptericola rhizosphaerae TaxID=3377837 RepID=UPI00383B44E7
MSIPYVYSLLETRVRIGALLESMVAGDTGPLILGSRGAPTGTLLTFDLFDEMRDQLAAFEAARHVDRVAARLTHPSGPSTAPLGSLLDGVDDDAPVTFWPDLVSDLRTTATAGLHDALRAAAGGRLEGTALTSRGESDWRWFLATTTPTGRPAEGWHLIWRATADGVEVVAALPMSDLLARAWQEGPEPKTEE